jgi:hypothetical protein
MNTSLGFRVIRLQRNNSRLESNRYVTAVVGHVDADRTASREREREERST